VSVLMIAATAGEAALLDQALSGRPDRARLVLTGMGAVNTAHALTRALLTEADRPRLVVQTGVAGAFVPAGLAVGSVVMATEEVYGDVGVITPDGWLSAEDIGIPLVVTDRGALFNHIPLDADLVARAAAVCESLVARTGRFLTLAQVTGVRTLGDALYDRFGALCESMEGAAAAHVCALYDVPFLEVRGISNLVEDRDRAKWRIQEAAEAAQRAVLRLLEHLPDVILREAKDPSSS
jgi:futalosine hydrolase